MEELVKNAKNGNIDAYEKIVTSIMPKLERIARIRLNNEDDIFDAVNDTIFSAYQNLSKLKNDEYFTTWIVKILINNCNKIYRENKRHLELISKVEIDVSKKVHADFSINKIDSKMNFEILIKNLNYDEKLVFLLYFDLNYTTSEIAKILNQSVNTVKSRLRRGKEKIINQQNNREMEV